MYTLWPELGISAASNNLRQTVHTARRTFDLSMGSRYLASRDESLVLCPENSLWVDVDAFEEAARTARRSREPAAYRVALALEVARELVGAYPGGAWLVELAPLSEGALVAQAVAAVLGVNDAARTLAYRRTR